MDVVQRRAALVLFACAVVGCGGKKHSGVVEMARLSDWAKQNECATASVNPSDALAGAQFSCVKSLGECGCRAVVSARSKSGGAKADTVQILVANCRHVTGSRAVTDLMTFVLDTAIGMNPTMPLQDGDVHAPSTAMSATHHYQHSDHPDTDYTMEWSRDVFSDGKPQRTETYRIVVSTPATARDLKMTWSETPTISTPPTCTSHPPTDEDMASIPASPPIPVRLRCPPAADTAEVPAFDIDKQLVTREQYTKCVDAHVCSEDADDFPLAAVVSHASAEAYCKWRHARLPTWHEWQRAVRGSDAKLYPTGSAWDAATGCRVPTMQGDPAGMVRCENTSADGVTYYVQDSNDEWTSDDDCMDPKAPTQRGPVSLLTGIEVLGRGAPRPETDHAQFRCARAHGAK